MCSNNYQFSLTCTRLKGCSQETLLMLSLCQKERNNLVGEDLSCWYEGAAGLVLPTMLKMG